MREGMGAPRALVGVLRLARPIWKNLEAVSHTLLYDYAVAERHGPREAARPRAVGVDRHADLVVTGAKGPGVAPARGCTRRADAGRDAGPAGQSHNVSMKVLAPVVEEFLRDHGDAPHAGILAAARRGDEDAFRRLVEPHRGELHAHCYRMLGSLQDAEDALQETLLRAWRGLGGFDASRPLRPWLYRIATNACLDALARRRSACCGSRARGRRSPPTAPASRSSSRPGSSRIRTKLSASRRRLPRPRRGTSARESVELAFVAALQHLSPRQRAVLILREVLGFSARRSHSRSTRPQPPSTARLSARRTVDEVRPERSQQETLRSLGDEAAPAGAAVRRGVGEVATSTGWSRCSRRTSRSRCRRSRWWSGREAVVEFMVRTGKPPLRHLLTRAAGQPAVAWYVRRDGVYRPTSIEVLAVEGDRVTNVTAFASPALFPFFGLPAELAAG